MKSRVGGSERRGNGCPLQLAERGAHTCKQSSRWAGKTFFSELETGVLLLLLLLLLLLPVPALRRSGLVPTGDRSTCVVDANAVLHYYEVRVLQQPTACRVYTLHGATVPTAPWQQEHALAAAANPLLRASKQMNNFLGLRLRR